jgi:hypothetical protein
MGVKHQVLVPLLFVVASTVLQSCGHIPQAKNRRILIHGDPKDEPRARLRLSSNQLESAHQRALMLRGIFAEGGWSSRPIELRVEESVPEALRNGLQQAAESWNAVLGFEMVVFGEDVPTWNKELFARHERPWSTVGAETRWTDNTLKDDFVIATTIWKNDPNHRRRIVSGHIVFNDQTYDFVDALNVPPPPEPEDEGFMVDAESVALHELGHLLGMAHVDIQSSVMYPVIDTGHGVAKRTLDPSDVERVRSIYRHLVDSSSGQGAP